MTIESSGAISLGTKAGTDRSISAEFGGDAPHSLSEYYDKGNAPASGEIQMGADFHGTSDSSSGGSIVTNGLVWHYDASNSSSYPGSGTTWTDLVSSIAGTLTNSPTFNSGVGGYFDFDGSNDYVVLPSQSISAAKTFSVWVNTDSNHNGIFISADRGNPENNERLFQFKKKNTGKIQFIGFSDYWTYVMLNTTNAISNGVWINATVVHSSSGSSKMYINGSLDSTSSVPTTTGSQPIYFAKNGFGSANQYNGKMATVYYYNRELTSAEVLTNFEALKDRFGV